MSRLGMATHCFTTPFQRAYIMSYSPHNALIFRSLHPWKHLVLMCILATFPEKQGSSGHMLFKKAAQSWVTAAGYVKFLQRCSALYWMLVYRLLSDTDIVIAWDTTNKTLRPDLMQPCLHHRLILSLKMTRLHIF